MALNIKDPEADRLVRELAEITGESITEAARKAFEERLLRLKAQPDRDDRHLDIVREIIARGRLRSAQTVDAPTEDEILGYNEHGIWS